MAKNTLSDNTIYCFKDPGCERVTEMFLEHHDKLFPLDAWTNVKNVSMSCKLAAFFKCGHFHPDKVTFANQV